MQFYCLQGKTLAQLKEKARRGMPLSTEVGAYIINICLDPNGESLDLFEMTTADMPDETVAEYRHLRNEFEIADELSYLCDRREIVLEAKADLDAGILPVDLIDDFITSSASKGGGKCWNLYEPTGSRIADVVKLHAQVQQRAPLSRSPSAAAPYRTHALPVPGARDAE